MDSQDFSGTVTITDDGDARPEASLLPRGTAISRYIVADLIGRGGMGVVYKAFDPELNRPVALKLLSIQRSGDQSSQDFAVHKSRLLREAQALAQLSHPNVVTVFDAGVVQTAAHGEAVFMAMELVEGKTLKDHLDDKRCAPETLLEILKAAGRGLAAAHKVGIVHRDFKPGNVIIGNDGRVRVIDFGLARGAGTEPPSHPAEEPAGKLDSSGSLSRPGPCGEPQGRQSPQQNLLSTSLTQAGAVVGTPHYMAPEQHLLQTADDRSDQFAFCVVLFEVLYGQRPFSGRSLKEMVNRISLGQVERPAGRAAPSWLDRIALRGLAVDPAARYGSMEVLLADLENDPAVARARHRAKVLRWLIAAGFLLCAGAAGYGIWYGMTRGGRLCEGGQEKLAGVWDDAVRASIQAAFAKTGRPHARETFERLGKVLDSHTAKWLAMRRAACEATHVKGEQSDKLLDLRMQCLDRRLGETRALTELFASRPDAGVLDKAVEAALGLIGMATCANEKALLAEVPLPEDPRIRKQVTALRHRLNQVDALENTGKYKEGLQLAKETLAATEVIGYPPVLSEAGLRVGSLLEKTGRYPESERQLRRAYLVAESCGHIEIKAKTLNHLVFVVGERQARFREGEWFGAEAEATISYYRDQGEILADWNNNLGNVAYQKGDYNLALEHHQRALAIRESVLGPEHPDVAKSHNNIGIIFIDNGEYDKALEHHTQTLTILMKSLGSEHPDVAKSFNNIGNVFREKGEYDQALENYQKAVKIKEDALGPEHPNVASSLEGLGEVYFHKGDFDRAQQYDARALRIWEKALGSFHQLLTYPLSSLGWIELQRKQARKAIPFFERVLSICGQDRCTGADQEPLSHARFGLAIALESIGGDRVKTASLAREALKFFKTLKSVPGTKMRNAAEAWLRERGVTVE